MGGLIILLATVIPTLLWAPLTNRFVVVAILAMLWTGAIGFLDDYLKIVEGKIARAGGQVEAGRASVLRPGAGLYLLYFPVVSPRHDAGQRHDAAVLQVHAWCSSRPWLYVVFVTFVVTGTSNAVNLTDGLDGLATGLTAIAAAAFAVFAYVLGRIDATSYLQFLSPRRGRADRLLRRADGRRLGFLWFNAHPAQVFMGDTGSLAIGGALGTVSILLKAEFLLVIIGGVFVAEQVSVMLQIGVYKWFKRTRGREYADAHRVFRMAPLHHHFEKQGWAETTVVTRFYILGILCAPARARHPQAAVMRRRLRRKWP